MTDVWQLKIASLPVTIWKSDSDKSAQKTDTYTHILLKDLMIPNNFGPYTLQVDWIQFIKIRPNPKLQRPY